MKRFLLIDPWITDFAAYDFWIKPLGLLCLAALLREAGAKVELLDCLDRHDPGWLAWQGWNSARERWDGTGKFHREPIPKPPVLADVPRRFCRYGWTPGYLRSRLRQMERPHAVLVTSGMTYWYPGVREVISEVKKEWPGVPVLLGGIYATLCPEHATREMGADYVLPGPLSGESLRQLWDLLELQAPPSPQWFAELESLPYDLYPNLRSAAMLTGLGCPFRCSFCASGILQPQLVRRDPKVVAAEIATLNRSRGVVHFAFFDDALLVAAEKHFLPICEELRRLGVHASFHTPNGLHIRMITPDVAEAMAAVNFRTVRLSFETSNPERQRAMGSKASEEDLALALERLESAGYRRNEVGVYVLAGLPGQGAGEVVESLLAVARLGAKASLAIFSPIPGTAEWRKSVESGLFPADADPLLGNDTRVPLRSPQFDLSAVQRLRDLTRWLNRRVEEGLFNFPDRECLVGWVLGEAEFRLAGAEAVGGTSGHLRGMGA
jgi:hypothetical protein